MVSSRLGRNYAKSRARVRMMLLRSLTVRSTWTSSSSDFFSGFWRKAMSWSQEPQRNYLMILFLLGKLRLRMSLKVAARTRRHSFLRVGEWVGSVAA